MTSQKPTRITKAQYATQKGITVEQLNQYQMDFLQCEGYLDNGRECQTLDEYINAVRRPSMYNESEATILACERGEICGAN